MKNQPLQQNLSPEQVQILAQAGDNTNLMKAPSAFEDTYSENKILYRKILINSVEVYEYSNNSADVLYNVKFSLMGNNLGNYIIQNNTSVERICFAYWRCSAGKLRTYCTAGGTNENSGGHFFRKI
jgi:hypothetical protein